MQNSLLPCPFCGGKATIENEGTQADITCDDCSTSYNIQISDYFTYDERHNDPDFKWLDAPIYGYAPKGKQRAIDILTNLWNTRADNTAQLLEALIKIFDSIVPENGSFSSDAYIPVAERFRVTKAIETALVGK